MKKRKLLILFLMLITVSGIKSQNWMQKGSDIHNTYASWTGNGHSVATNNDGSRIIVGAPYEASYNAKIYQWNASTQSWDAEVGYSGYGSASKFGWDVDMSDDGNRAIIVQGYGIGRIYVKTYSSGSWQSSGDIITNCYEFKCALSGDGNYIAYNDNVNNCIKVFYHNGSSWVQRGSNINGFTGQHEEIDMSYDGSRVVAGGFYDGSYKVKVFQWTGSDWSEMAGTISSSSSSFGKAVSISGDGERIAIGYPGTNSYVYVYEYNNVSYMWSQIKSWSFNYTNPQMGKAVSISNDGTVVSMVSQGSASYYYSQLYTYKNTSGTTWERVGQIIYYLPAPSSPADYGYHSVDLSGNGEQVVVGNYTYQGYLGFVRSYAPVTTPTTQASNIAFSNVQHNQMQLNWTNGDGMSRAVFMKAGNSGSLSVTQNNSYTANASFGSGSNIYYGSSYWYCVYNGTGSSVTVSNLSPNTDYQCQVFEYNGNLGNYKQYLNDTETGNPANQTTGTTTPTVSSTTAISAITATTASSGGNVSSDGGLSVTARGVVWNTGGTPTIESYTGITSDGTGTGSFTSSLTNLTGNTTYHVRAYATNSSGTSYGNQLSFTTSGYSDITWDGSESSDWNTAANWDLNVVPTSNHNVTIPSGATNDPLIDATDNASCTNLTINEGASLTINDEGSLRTYGNVSGSVDINKNIINDNKWHFISIPNNNTTAGSHFNEMYLQKWDETTPQWIDIIDEEEGLTPAKGYSLWSASGKGSFTFSGNPNTGPQSIGITFTDNSTENDGANLVGNPYPSYLDWTLVNGYGSKYTWNGTAYQAYTQTGSYGEGSQYVAPFEAFFIVTNSNTTFNLNNNMRVDNPGDKKNALKLSHTVVLTAHSKNYSDALYIVFDENASYKFEIKRDAWKFKSGTSGISQLWSQCPDGNLAVDVRPVSETIQLGFTNNEAGIYSIGIKEIADISSAIIEDTKLNIFHDLTEGDYSFNWSLNDAETRFKLHFNTTAVEDLNIDGVQVYVAASNIIIQSKLQLERIILTDITGRTLGVWENAQQIPAPKTSGVYLVTVESENQQITKKIIIE